MLQVIKKKKLNSNDLNLIKIEADILKGLNHPNVVKFKHVSYSQNFIPKIKEIGGKLFLALELLEGGRLSNLIKNRKYQGFSDAEASSIMACIMKAIEYIHHRGIVHRDLKAW